MERLAKEVYEGKTDAKIIDEGYILSTYKELNVAAEKGYGKDWLKVNKSTGNIAPEVIELQKNIYKFSGAKSAIVLEQINQILQKQLPWNQFKNEVLKLNPLYNKNYLQAEWQTANQSAKHARDWLYYNENTKLYPNLAYRTQGDERVRDAHSLLNGIVAPINSDFWKTHYPPNGWRCRCYVVQTAANVTPGRKDDPTVLPEFRGNVALDEEIFTQKGSFFKLLNKDYKAKTNAELMKLNAPYDEAYKTKKGKKVLVNIFADENDKLKNIESAMVIVDQLDVPVVYIRPHVNVQKHKNPEYFINGVVSDLKNLETTKGITHAFDTAKEQFKEFNSHSLVFDFSNISISKKEIIDQLNNKVTKTRGKKIKELYFIKGNKACVLDRNQIINGDFKALDDIL